MKMGGRLVPLKSQAADVFRRARRLCVEGADHGFPGRFRARPCSDMAVAELVRGMAVPAVRLVHFRE
jgi:hypothetical protein